MATVTDWPQLQVAVISECRGEVCWQRGWEATDAAYPTTMDMDHGSI